MVRELEVLGIAAVNGKGEHMRQERKAVGSQSMSKGAFRPCQGPLESLEVADPGIPDLQTPARLLLPSSYDKPPDLLAGLSLPARSVLPFSWLDISGPRIPFPLRAHWPKDTCAWFIGPASPVSAVSCSPQSPPVGVGPSQSCFRTLVSQMA